MKLKGYVREIDPSTNENVFTEVMSLDVSTIIKMFPVCVASAMFRHDVYWRMEDDRWTGLKKGFWAMCGLWNGRAWQTVP